MNNYVYALIDPRPDEIRHRSGTVFYIGRGVGDRVFDHERTAEKADDQVEYEKLQRIQQIEQAGAHVKRVILSWGLTADEAKVVEGAMIDFFELVGQHNYGSASTNLIPGYHNDDQDAAMLRYGTVEEMNARLAMPTISLKSLADQHIGVITLGKPSDPLDAPNPQLLGTAAFNSDKVARRALGNWVIRAADIDKLKYLLVVTHGDYVIVGAFKILKHGNFTGKNKKYQRTRIYWRDSATDKDQPLAINPYVEPVDTINGIQVGPNRKLGEIWFYLQRSGLNIVDNK